MRFFKVVLASALGYFLAALIVIGLLFFIGISIASSSKPDVKIPEGSVLNMKLNYPIQDRVAMDDVSLALSAIDPNKEIPIGLNDILRSIDKAKTDDNIKGILLDLTTFSAGYAKLSEIRNKLEDFKESGKFIYAYADYYYFPTYYMASVADSVFINPQGEMSFTGIVAQVAFFSRALEKLGIEMQAVRAGKFKGAVEAYTRTGLSPENKEQIDAYVNSVFDQILGKVSKSRTLSVEQLKSDADKLELNSASDFVEKGYLDGTVYRDQFYSAMKVRMGIDDDHKVALVSEVKYARSLGRYGTGTDKIAVIYASGDIIGGKGDGTQIAADDMAAALKRVRLDDGVKSVVLRIDSRGGSSLASDIIWREAKLLAETKPLVVSMGDVAASGGYYIATPGRKIFAEPTTITGSIGVFGLIPNAKKLLNDKLGIDFEYVGTGSHSDIGRIDGPMSEGERQYIESIIDRIYDTFLSRVAEGRSMTKEQVHELAQGRVWTGIMAKEVGLVDEMGGLQDAIAFAASEAGLSEYRVREYPKAIDPVQAIVQKIQGNMKMENQLKEFARPLGFSSYIEHLSAFKKWGAQHSVQAMMLYDIKLTNYSLR